MSSSGAPVGDVMTWGDNTCMVLGLTTRATGRKRPFPVALLNKSAPSGYTRILPRCVAAVASGVHSVAVSERGELWTWGVNDEGQLGRPIPRDDDEAPAVPGKVEVRGDLVGRAIAKGAPAPRVVAAAATDAATFALLAGGVVVGCGVFKDDAELGFSPLNRGRQHGLARVAGPLLLPETDDEPAAGKKRKRDAAAPPPHASWPVASIAAGNAHVVMLAEDPAPRRSAAAPRRVVLTAGAGAQGQLGRVGPRVSPSPRGVAAMLAPAPVRMPRGAGRPVAVFAGGWHAFAITDEDVVVGWGLNNWGQLGLDVDATQSAGGNGCAFVPRIVPALSKRGVAQLACGEHHTVARTRAGEVLTCGRYAYGRLGRAPPSGCALEMGDAAVWEPAPVAFPPGVRAAEVAAGMKESAATDAEGRVWMWGSGSGNMQGRGDDEEDVMRPELVPEKEAYAHWRPKEQRIAAVSIGAQHVMAIATPGHAGEWAAAA